MPDYSLTKSLRFRLISYDHTPDIPHGLVAAIVKVGEAYFLSFASGWDLKLPDFEKFAKNSPAGVLSPIETAHPNAGFTLAFHREKERPLYLTKTAAEVSMATPQGVAKNQKLLQLSASPRHAVKVFPKVIASRSATAHPGLQLADDAGNILTGHANGAVVFSREADPAHQDYGEARQRFFVPIAEQFMGGPREVLLSASDASAKDLFLTHAYFDSSSTWRSAVTPTSVLHLDSDPFLNDGVSGAILSCPSPIENDFPAYFSYNLDRRYHLKMGAPTSVLRVLPCLRDEKHFGLCLMGKQVTDVPAWLKFPGAVAEERGYAWLEKGPAFTSLRLNPGDALALSAAKAPDYVLNPVYWLRSVKTKKVLLEEADHSIGTGPGAFSPDRLWRMQDGHLISQKSDRSLTLQTEGTKRKLMTAPAGEVSSPVSFVRGRAISFATSPQRETPPRNLAEATLAIVSNDKDKSLILDGESDAKRTEAWHLEQYRPFPRCHRNLLAELKPGRHFLLLTRADWRALWAFASPEDSAGQVSLEVPAPPWNAKFLWKYVEGRIVWAGSQTGLALTVSDDDGQVKLRVDACGWGMSPEGYLIKRGGECTMLTFTAGICALDYKAPQALGQLWQLLPVDV